MTEPSRASRWRLFCTIALLLAWVAPSAAELRLAVAAGPVSLPFYVADSAGHFAAEGLDARLQPCASGRACFQLLADGQADAATAAELLVTLSSFGDARYTILASVSSSTHQIKLVARRSAGIDGAAALRGKRIATVAGTSAHYFLDTWLLYHGIDARDTTLVPLAPDRLAAALQRRQVDAVAIWEPHAAAARAALADDVAPLPSPRVYTQHFTLVARRTALAGREAELLRLLRALQRAQRLIAERPDAAGAMLAARLQIDPAAAAAQLREHDFRLRLDQTLVATMDSQARWALAAGLVAPGLEPGNLLRTIEPALLRQTVPGAVGMVR